MDLLIARDTNKPIFSTFDLLFRRIESVTAKC